MIDARHSFIRASERFRILAIRCRLDHHWLTHYRSRRNVSWSGAGCRGEPAIDTVTLILAYAAIRDFHGVVNFSGLGPVALPGHPKSSKQIQTNTLQRASVRYWAVSGSSSYFFFFCEGSYIHVGRQHVLAGNSAEAGPATLGFAINPLARESDTTVSS